MESMAMAMANLSIDPDDAEAPGGRMVSVDGRVLPLRGVTLAADARGGLARVVLEQRFHNPYPDPLEVTYTMPLPADGAVSGYAFRIGDRRVVGEVDRRTRARERYEEAIFDGRAAGLVEQERSSLFTQRLGNVPPGAEVVAELTVDQRLAWLEEGAWEWRFPTVVAPRYLGAPGRVGDARALSVEVADGPLPARLALRMTVRDALAGGRAPESPSHALAPRVVGEAWEVGLAAAAGAPLDRDVVVRWPVAAPSVGVSLDVMSDAALEALHRRPATAGAPDGAGSAADGAPAPLDAAALPDGTYGLLTLVPPADPLPPVPRDVVLLLDTSGSMDGGPIEQLRRVATALVSSLGEADSLQMVEFSTVARRWRDEPARVTAPARQAALAWVAELRASGGTEMRRGILEALAGVRDEAQRQVVLVTDGLIGFEAEIVGEIVHRLPRASRVHVVGVGSSVNRSLTAPAARAGRGVEVVLGLGEDPERAARRLLARSVAPSVVDVVVGGDALLDVAPSRVPDLYAGAPVVVAVRLARAGGTLTVRGRGARGPWQQEVVVPPSASASAAAASAAGARRGSTALAALHAREQVEDLETLLAAGEPREAIDARIETLGVRFQIATRLTSWVAISDERSVDPTAPTRRVTVPQELPSGMSAEGLGLRGARQHLRLSQGVTPGSMPVMQRTMALDLAAPSPSAPAMKGRVREPTGSAGAVPPPEERRMLGGGVLGAVGRLFGRGGARRDEGQAVSPAQPAPGTPVTRSAAPTGGAPVTPSGAPTAGAPVTLRGRLLRRKKERLVVEVRLEAPLPWAAPLSAWVAFADGSHALLAIDASHTTRVGALRAGQLLRLSLVEPHPGAAPLTVTLDSGGVTLVISLA